MRTKNPFQLISAFFREIILFAGKYSFGKPAHGIILVTLVTRLAFLPFTIKSDHITRKMKVLRPEISVIGQKYRSAKGTISAELQPKMHREIMELYRQENINPSFGCWTVALQASFFLLIKYTMRSAKNDPRFTSGGILWFRDLSKPDPYFVLPVLTTILGLATEWMQIPKDKEQDEQQRQINFIRQLTPLTTGLSMLRLSAGETLYMTVSAAFEVIQYYFLTKGGKLPLSSSIGVTVITPLAAEESTEEKL